MIIKKPNNKGGQKVHEKAIITVDAELEIACQDRDKIACLRILRIREDVGSFDSRIKERFRDWMAHCAHNTRCYCFEFCGRLSRLLGWQTAVCNHCDFRHSSGKSPASGLVTLKAERGLMPLLQNAVVDGLFRPRSVEPWILADLERYQPKGFKQIKSGRTKDDELFALNLSELMPSDTLSAELALKQAGLRGPAIKRR